MHNPLGVPKLNENKTLQSIWEYLSPSLTLFSLRRNNIIHSCDIHLLFNKKKLFNFGYEVMEIDKENSFTQKEAWQYIQMRDNTCIMSGKTKHKTNKVQRTTIILNVIPC